MFHDVNNLIKGYSIFKGYLVVGGNLKIIRNAGVGGIK